MKSRLNVLILAAGYATRLYPLTRKVPKTLLPVGGRPVLSHQMRALDELDPRASVTVVTNHRFAAQFRHWRGKLPLRQRSRVMILDDGTTTPENRLGAIGDIGFYLNRVFRGGALFIMASDNLLSVSLRGFLSKARGWPAAVAVRKLQSGLDPSRYGILVLGRDRRVSKFLEKPKRAPSRWISMGLYFFQSAAVDWIRTYLAQGRNPDAPGFFWEWAVRRHRVVAVPVGGRWFDIGDLESLKRADGYFKKRARPGSCRVEAGEE